MARQRGHHNATHVRWTGRAGWRDYSLKTLILDGDWTFVTMNSADFRGPAHAPGTKGQYAGVELHAGLVCLNGPVGMRRAAQLRLFKAVLDLVEGQPDLVNRVVEATLEDEAGEVELIGYAMPP